MRIATLVLPLLMVFTGAVGASEEDASAPWFTNVADELGFEGVRAKDCVLVDLDGDRYLDLCIDRQHFFLSRDKGARFEAHSEHGIPYPQTRVVPLGRDGKPDEAKAKERPFRPQYLYFADVDNDGDADAIYGVHSSWDFYDGRGWRYVAGADHGHRSKVFLNDGAGRFTPAAATGFAAKEATGPAMALAILDYDGDGRLDLYEGREYRQYGVLYGCGVDRLWKGAGDGIFTDVTEAAGLMTVPEPGGHRSSRPSYGVTHADIDGDGRQDLLQMAYGRQWNYLWHNRGDGTFHEIGFDSGYAGDDITHGRYPDWLKQRMPGRKDEQPFRSNGNTFDCAVGDIDNDGDLDLFLGGIAHAWAGESSDLPSLLVNDGGSPPTFRRKTVREFLPARTFRSERWNYGDLHVAFVDVDNDMRLDLLIGSGDYPDGQFLRLYRQREDGTFEEATELAGFDWEGCGDLSLGDIDRDGDVDIVAGRSFMRLSQAHRDKYMGGIKLNQVGVFRNDIANRNGNHWLNVQLVGRGTGPGACNRAGLGCRVLVTAGGVTQIREIRGGSGLANHQDAPEAHFGLGPNAVVDRLEIRWSATGARPQVFERVAADRHIVVSQGSRTLQVSRPSPALRKGARSSRRPRRCR